jgi:hypothetical protein
MVGPTAVDVVAMKRDGGSRGAQNSQAFSADIASSVKPLTHGACGGFPALDSSLGPRNSRVRTRP